jgi:hypothetical protein
MPTYLSRYTLLVTLALALLLVGPTLATADEASEHYPGRYAAVCKPAPIVGCVCEADSLGQPSIFPQSVDAAGDGTNLIQDVELLRLIDWMRRTCVAVTKPANFR